MTFSILGMCKKTGKMGYASSTATAAIGWRCLRVVRGCGLITVQANGDVRRLLVGTRLMEQGHLPAKVLKDLSDGDPFFENRQIAILDRYGRHAVHTGANVIGYAGQVVGDDHVATGNILVGEIVPQSMAAAFVASEGRELEDRLMLAVEAGRDAGGQPDGETSAAIAVYGEHEFPLVDLRVDMSLAPVEELRRIFDWYKPLIPFYTQRALDPTSVPRYKKYLSDKELPLNPFAA